MTKEDRITFNTLYEVMLKDKEKHPLDYTNDNNKLEKFETVFSDGSTDVSVRMFYNGALFNTDIVICDDDRVLGKLFYTESKNAIEIYNKFDALVDMCKNHKISYLLKNGKKFFDRNC